MTLDFQARAAKCSDDPAGEDEIGFHAGLD
jgi:hypothetical protein